MSLEVEKYKAFAVLLEQVRSEIGTSQLDANGVRERITQVQQFFQQSVLQDAPNQTDYLALEREQSYKTEMSKQLRLLEIDLTFLQGARKPATVQTRLKAIDERLATLVRYCEGVRS